MISVILTDGKVLFWNIDQKVVSIPSMIETHNEGNNGNRIPLGGVMFAPPPSPYVIHMCPPMTAKNWKEWKSLLAIGKERIKLNHFLIKDLFRLYKWRYSYFLS